MPLSPLGPKMGFVANFYRDLKTTVQLAKVELK